MHHTVVTQEEVEKIAKLANLNLQPEEKSLFASQFTETIKVIDGLSDINTENIEETYQTNGLVNISREDELDESSILTQDQALSGAKITHNGYFVVPRVFEN